MNVSELVVGNHYYRVVGTKLVEVELLSTTGQNRPMNCVVRDVNQQSQDTKTCISSWFLHENKQSALCQALTNLNNDIQALEEDIDDLLYKLRTIRENQSTILMLLTASLKPESGAESFGGSHEG